MKNKNVILGVTGGIAAYKASELVRLLKKEGANVWPVMTKAATKFVTPLTFTTLSGNPTACELFPQTDNSASQIEKTPEAKPKSEPKSAIDHIDIADWADLMIVAPATANFIGKAASGIADDLLSTMVMACPAPKIIAPAMNNRMYENPIVAANIEKLAKFGYIFVGPARGELACGWEGTGRLAELDDIVEAARDALTNKDLIGEKFLVTAGPTREAMDPVRFLSNASSGKMGHEIARAAKRRGAEVVLITGRSGEAPPPGVAIVRVESADELMDEAMRYYGATTVVVMTAAVSDFKPTARHSGKIKKPTGTLTLELEKTPDILREMGSVKHGKILVGFALETENPIENAKQKLHEKNLDMIVVNSPLAIDSENNQVTIIDSADMAETLPLMSKSQVASAVLDRVAAIKGS